VTTRISTATIATASRLTWIRAPRLSQTFASLSAPTIASARLRALR